MKYNHNKGLLTPQVIANCEDGMLKSAVKNSLYSLTSTQSNPPVAIVAVLECYFSQLRVTCETKGKHCLSLNIFCGLKSLYLISGLIIHLKCKPIKNAIFCRTSLDIHFPFTPVEMQWLFNILKIHMEQKEAQSGVWCGQCTFLRTELPQPLVGGPTAANVELTMQKNKCPRGSKPLWNDPKVSHTEEVHESSDMSRKMLWSAPKSLQKLGAAVAGPLSTAMGMRWGQGTGRNSKGHPSWQRSRASQHLSHSLGCS